MDAEQLKLDDIRLRQIIGLYERTDIRTAINGIINSAIEYATSIERSSGGDCVAIVQFKAFITSKIVKPYLAHQAGCIGYCMTLNKTRHQAEQYCQVDSLPDIQTEIFEPIDLIVVQCKSKGNVIRNVEEWMESIENINSGQTFEESRQAIDNLIKNRYPWMDYLVVVYKDLWGFDNHCVGGSLTKFRFRKRNIVLYLHKNDCKNWPNCHDLTISSDCNNNGITSSVQEAFVFNRNHYKYAHRAYKNAHIALSYLKMKKPLAIMVIRKDYSKGEHAWGFQTLRYFFCEFTINHGLKIYIMYDQDSVAKTQSSGFGLDDVTTANETFYNNRSYLAQCGKPCIFPFKYNGKIYEYCTDVDHVKPWCSTKVDVKNGRKTVPGNWKDCVKECSPEGPVVKRLQHNCGKPCIFPFKYKGNYYGSCTSVNHNKPWCSTKVSGNNHQTVADNWKDCVKECFPK